MAKERPAGLGLVDRLLLVLAWVATCGVVYLLGVYVGKGLQERRLGLDERMVRLPVSSKPPPEGRRAKAESDLTFYDTLVPAPAGRTGPAPSPAAGGSSPAGAAATSPAAGAGAAPTAPMPSARLAAPAPAAAPPPSVTARPPASAADEGLAVGPPAAGARAAGVPPAAPLAPAAAGGQGGGWTVQANPTRSREEAEALSRRLEGRGYDAVVVRVPRDGDVWYRVRIGRYQTPEQATEAMQRLREREGVPHVFVASE